MPSLSTLRKAWAHPRGCGADLLRGSGRLCGLGSSPRVRGRQSTFTARPAGSGLIPAGAGQTRADAGVLGDVPAHPRGCGADLDDRGDLQRPDGSSPRVRGRPAHAPTRWRGRGLIPAGAGQTPCTCSFARCTRAHPRGCGADAPGGLPAPALLGSSPRVRGRPTSNRLSHPLDGLIPAGAGQTAPARLASASHAAHPRGCGADIAQQVDVIDQQGSSPRVRGRPSGLPAVSQMRRAHPRGCGADAVVISASLGALGSSPRVRGRQESRRFSEESHGLIPAGAGQTNPNTPAPTSKPAHPRGCGADDSWTPLGCSSWGSSPRVRGRLVGVPRLQLVHGLIPAGAGQTLRNQQGCVD